MVLADPESGGPNGPCTANPGHPFMKYINFYLYNYGVKDNSFPSLGRFFPIGVGAGQPASFKP
jgi:hypothetical protein